MFDLRDYQQESLDAIKFGHEEHDSVLLELPTGTGKTIVFCKYASSWEHGRTMVVAPQITLIGQAARKICKETGIFPAIEQAENRSNESSEDMRNPYVVASKQSLCGPSKRYRRFQDIGLVIVDEAHYAATESYAGMLNWYRDRGAKILGVTATPKRHDKRAMGQLFDLCVYQYGIVEAKDDGWLVPIQVRVMQIEHLNLENVGTKKGFNGETDFITSQLLDLLEKPELVYEIAEATAKSTRGKKTAIYCASVNQACAVAHVLKEQYGLNSAWICADTKRCSKQDTQDRMKSFTEDADGVSHLCNVGMLTTGWDFPNLEAIVNARPTRSLSLYTQIMGRITRPCEEDDRPVVDGLDTAEERKAVIAASRKPHGLVIDLVDASLEHKLITAVDVLGGKWSLAEKKDVLQDALDADKAVDLDEVVSDRRKEEEERMKRELEKKKVKQATYNEMDVDPYGGSRGKGKSAGKNRRPATSSQLYRLERDLGTAIRQFDVSFGNATRMISQLNSGWTKDAVWRSTRLKRLDVPEMEPVSLFNQKVKPKDGVEAFFFG